MKIALVTNNYKPYSGGVVSAIDVLAQSLVQVGHQVFIITLDFEGYGNSCDGLVSIIRIFCPIRFKYKTNHIAIPWFPDQAILQILSQIKPDIIHTHHPFLLGKSALKAGQRLKIPVVFTYHSQYEKFSHWVPLPEIFSANLIRNAAFKYCQKVSGIIAPSSFIYNQLTSCNLQRPVSVIPSAVSQLFLTDVFAYKKYRPDFELLTVSRFAPEKNIYFLLDMFFDLVQFNHNRFRLKLVGYGPELNNLKKYTYQFLGLKLNQVSFVEKPTKHELKHYYQNADLFVFASLSETQGLVLAESMACGTPVVALNGPGQQDLVINGLNGYLASSQAEMVKIIQKIAKNPKLHQKLQIWAFNSGQKYQPQVLANYLIAYYEQLCKQISRSF